MTRSVVFWLVKDTFRQAWASRVSHLIFALTGACMLLCLSIRIDSAPPMRPPGAFELAGADGEPLTDPGQRSGRFGLGFGGLSVGMFRDVDDQVHFVQAILAKWVAGASGTLLAVIWAAGFLPEFLQARTIAVMLVKPVPRWVLLIGKYLGTLVFVSAHVGLFVVGTWLALWLSTGNASPGYLLCLPLLVLHFAVIHAASTLIAVCTRSATATAFGTIIFWCLCFAMNRGRHLGFASTEQHAPHSFRWAVEAGYWFLPKPADFAILLDRVMRIDLHFRTLPEAELLWPVASVLASVAFAVCLLIVASKEFDAIEY